MPAKTPPKFVVELVVQDSELTTKKAVKEFVMRATNHLADLVRVRKVDID
jgi:hypothetical protein